MRRKAVIFWAVVFVLAFAAASGCDSREEEKYAAIVEAAQGRAALAATQVSLARAERENVQLKTEVDKLSSEVQRVKEERDEAIARQSHLEETMRQLEQKAKATQG